MATPIKAVTGVGGLGMGNVPGVHLSLHWEPAPVIVAAQFTVFGMQLRSFREPLNRSIRQVMIPSIRKNFEEEGRPPWLPLSEATIEIREREGFASGPILQRTGNLRRSATQLNIWVIDSEKAYIRELPARSWYGTIHQGGAAGKAMSLRAPIPARPFLLIQDEDADKIQEVFIEWVAERARLSGLFGRVSIGGISIRELVSGA
jgi:phage virion morphogenesis protein